MILLNDMRLNVNNFPDNTLFLRIENFSLLASTGQGAVKEFTISWYYESDAELFAIQCLVDKLRPVGKPITLKMPYIPHARMDRVQNEKDVFTLKTFCKIINAMNFKEVIVIDPHSNVSTALLDRVKVIKGDYVLKEILSHDDFDIPNDYVLFYPDDGAKKRYGTSKPCATGTKVRNWETGRIESLTIDNPEVVKDKNIVIVDDICSYGGTFHKSAVALKEAGAKDIYLIVTHAENAIYKGEIFPSGLFKAVYSTDSIPQKSDCGSSEVKTISCEKIMKEVI